MSVSTALPPAELRPSDRARSLHDQLREVWAVRERSAHAAAALLVSIADEGAYAELGYTSIAAYAAAVLDVTMRQARDLLRIGRALPRLPELDRAFAEGRLSWTKARELVRVVEPRTEAAWVERTCAISGHELEQLVASADRGEPPPTRAGRRDALTRLVFPTATADAEVVRDALAWFRAQSRVGDDVDDGALLAMMLKRAVHDLREAEVAEGRTPPSLEPYRVVVEHCPDCGAAHGGDHELTDTAALEASCDAEVVEMRPGPDRGKLSHGIPPKTRRAVLIRDGHRCRVPGCRNRNWIHVHHVHARACGGGHDEEKLITCCDAHHRLIHVGLLGVSVRDGQFEFRFGDGVVLRRPIHPRGSPLRCNGKSARSLAVTHEE